MIDLEQELTTAMRERTDGLRPSRDLLAAARRARSRRGLAVKATSAVGVLGLGGAVALSLPGLTTAGPAPAGPVSSGPVSVSSGPVSSGPVSSGPAPVRLSVELISERVKAVLADQRGTVQFLSARVAGGGLEPSRSEIWYDTVTGAQRSRGLAADGTVQSDFSIARRGDRLLSRVVDYPSRTWYTASDRARLERPPGGLLTGDPAQLKAELEEGTWTLAGTEGGVLHLTRSFDEGAAGMELWVDADSFRVVRLAATKPAERGPVRQEATVSWLPRTGAVLADLVAEPPAGFRRIERPADVPVEGPGQG